MKKLTILTLLASCILSAHAQEFIMQEGRTCIIIHTNIGSEGSGINNIGSEGSGINNIGSEGSGINDIGSEGSGINDIGSEGSGIQKFCTIKII